jgi:uncharacterized protein DUF6174
MTYKSIAVGCVALLLSACANATSPSGTSEQAGPPTDLAGAKAAWEQAGIDSYTLVVEATGCMACGGPDPFKTSTTVTDGKITDRDLPPGLRPMGAPCVEDLFKWIEVAGPQGVKEIEYNDVGVPVEMRLDNPEMSDDQGDYRITFEES